MNHRLLIIGIIFLILPFCGCICFDNSIHVVRNYTHNASNNVTMIILKEDWQNLTVIESNSNEIKINESFYMNAGITTYTKYKINGNVDSGIIIRDYVRFYGNESNLTIYIDLRSSIDRFETRNADARIDIYLPKNTNYTIDYVGWDYKFP
jgi:hypothetical protein